MARLITTIACLVALVAFALPANADTASSGPGAAAPGASFLDENTPQAESERHTDRWYALPIVAMDGLAYGVTISALRRDQGLHSTKQTLAAGLLGLALGGPFVHIFQDEPRRAMTSLALRTVVPVAGFFVVSYVNRNSNHCGSVDGFLECGARTGVPFGVAMLIVGQLTDYLYLSHDRPTTQKYRPPGLTWHPVLAASPAGDATLGLAGSW